MIHQRAIEERAAYINSFPFAREGLRFSQLTESLAKVAREAALMSGGTGLDDRLLDLAAQAVAWLEARRADRLGLARERLEDTSPLGLPGGGQGGPVL